MRILDTGTILYRIIPVEWLDDLHGHPNQDTIAKIEAKNKELRAEHRDIFVGPNIGDLPNWYSDQVFGQQQFTGTNPTTIQRASQDWIQQFSKAAEAQQNSAVVQLLSNCLSDGSLYVQDCSYFRKACGVSPDAVLKSDDGDSFACASVTLFQLNDDGCLHPLGIAIDYKGSMENSVVIFNKRLRSTDSTASEAGDWPWRYAKTCAQVSDWMQHEIIVHLVNTHLVEEVVIVATHRSFETNHIVFRLLSPHWLKTLSLNAAARSTLVPSVINKVVGLTEDQVYTYIREAYTRFDWQKHYVPNDLEARGFPLEELIRGDKKYHNYAYGRNIILMWRVLHKFVSSALATVYTTDDQVACDEHIKEWCNEMRSANGGQMSTFPIITTIQGLADAITMCIHIASPQHTAVNYLQDYYQAFVINKPPALCSPLPSSLEALNAYQEQDLMNGLPANRPVDWLLASHLPHLLSSRVAEDQNLVTYAQSVACVAAQAALQKRQGEAEISKAAATLEKDLAELAIVFQKNSDELDDKRIPYTVMNPKDTAVSILI
jgi:hypothetical protein